MNQSEITQFKLELARAWLENGRDDLARNIVTKLIEDGLAKNAKGE